MNNVSVGDLRLVNFSSSTEHSTTTTPTTLMTTAPPRNNDWSAEVPTKSSTTTTTAFHNASRQEHDLTASTSTAHHLSECSRLFYVWRAARQKRRDSTNITVLLHVPSVGHLFRQRIRSSCNVATTETLSEFVAKLQRRVSSTALGRLTSKCPCARPEGGRVTHQVVTVDQFENRGNWQLGVTACKIPENKRDARIA